MLTAATSGYFSVLTIALLFCLLVFIPIVITIIVVVKSRRNIKRLEKKLGKDHRK